MSIRNRTASIAAIIIILAALLSIAAGTQNRAAIGEIEPLTANIENISLYLPTEKSDCYQLFYAGELAYFFPLPDPYGYGLDLYYTRFTPMESAICTLKTSWVAVYGDGVKGTPDMRVYLIDTDGLGMPGQKLDSLDIPYEQLPPEIGYVEVDWAGAGKQWTFRFGEEFCIAVTCIQNDPGDTLALLYDDGYGPHYGEFRSGLYFDNAFWTMYDAFTGDYDYVFLMASDICCYDLYDPVFWWKEPDDIYMPDFDQNQDDWQSFCGPAATANCLWWFDQRLPNWNIIPDGMTPPEFIEELADLMGTTPDSGTFIDSLQEGITDWLISQGCENRLVETTVYEPTYEYCREQLMDCQDVILLFGFWEITDIIPDMPEPGCNEIHWERIGGHYTTMAGVDSTGYRVGLSDPDKNAAVEYASLYPPSRFFGFYHEDPEAHNDGTTVSHDVYEVSTLGISPGGAWELPYYWDTEGKAITGYQSGVNPNPRNVKLDMTTWCGQVPDWVEIGAVVTEVEAAAIVCPNISTCEYYKPPYPDYAPFGMPDFDQKQNDWTSPHTGGWSWCGPVALFNCMWWFDSKFEAVPTPPSHISDNYPLITPQGQWDDHTPPNVQPSIEQLAPLCNVDVTVPGTAFGDLESGFHAWLAQNNITGYYGTHALVGGDFEEIRDSILSCQNVILLLGFYEMISPTECQWLGGHYVTAAGVCTTSTDLCVSDPYFDYNEGEPPAGSAHDATIHNDAAKISGPHGTYHHDCYHLEPLASSVCPSPAGWECTDYPHDWSDLANFAGQNPITPGLSAGIYAGGEIRVLLDGALIICPLDTCENQSPGDFSGNGSIDVQDIVMLVAYLYQDGPPPTVPSNADPNGDCCVDYRDVWYLIDFYYGDGDAPVDCTCLNPPICIPAPPAHTPGKVKHNRDNYRPTDGSPLGTAWDELWPQYGVGWNLSGWIDNGDGYLSYCDTLEFTSQTTGKTVREHTQKVTPTLTTVSYTNPDDTVYFDLIVPEQPMIEPIQPGIGTFWHEVFPDYCRKFVLTSKTDWVNPAVQIGETVSMQALNGSDSGLAQSYVIIAIETDIVTIPLPVIGDANFHCKTAFVPPDGDPNGTQWLELWPDYFHDWTITGWFDNDDGKLSVDDYVDFINDETEDWRKSQIAWVGPKMTAIDGAETVYLEYMDYDNPDVHDIVAPIGTYWYEKYPDYYTLYVVFGWNDNGDGILSAGDVVVFRELVTQSSTIMNITSLGTGIVLEDIPPIPESLPDDITLENYTGFTPPDGDPTGVDWIEIRPNYAASWTITSWSDNGSGKLSVGDILRFDESKGINYNVAWVGPTGIIHGEHDTLLPDYRHICYPGFDNTDIVPVTSLEGIFWQQVWGVFGPMLFTVDWFDNGTELLDDGDTLLLQNMETGDFESYEFRGNLKCGLILQEVPVCDCRPGDANNDIALNLLDILWLIDYMYGSPQGPAPQPYTICSGDPNGDCTVNLLDILHLIANIYQEPVGEPPTCDCDTWLIECGVPLRK
ncbi:MAG: hypothetical protein JW763_09845 [candidate division Zixibacteria bacterium]|nr:hypothetical protein [candidate division Zixibacteria bacterium]